MTGSNLANAGQRPLIAAGYMVISTIGFVAMHVIIQRVSQDLHPFVTAFFRCLFGILVILPWFMKSGLEPLKTSKAGLLLLRAFINTLAMMLFFWALAITPIMTTTALAFTSPIMASVMAIFFFGERLGPRRIGAIVVGCIGVLIILRPGLIPLEIGPMLILVSCFLWAVTVLVVKIISRTESSVTITAYMTIMMAPMTFAFAYPFWETPSMEQILWLVLGGTLGSIGHLTMTQALKEADTSTVMPLDFLKLVWSALFSYALFLTIPDFWTQVGGVVICAASAYLAYRSHRELTPKFRS
jgi:drug/metabolite transporter (DMT)-like permease